MSNFFVKQDLFRVPLALKSELKLKTDNLFM